jgi:DNA-binding MarR family transcriptional regulator
MAALGAAVALAAPAAAQTQTYRCIGKDGKKYYSSTIPPQCVGRPVEQLNKQGLVVRRIDPEGDEKARAEKAELLAKKREAEAAHREERRRNQALLATYTSEKDIEDARARALSDNRKAVRDVETRIETARKRRAGYDKELEFYKGDAKPPAKLADDIRSAEVEIQANEQLLAVKKKEVTQINARYDEDKKRYRELTGKK